MQQVAAKCYLGIAIEQVIKQLKLEKSAKKIYDTFYQAFRTHYETLKNSYHDQAKIDGVLHEHFQYPIGDKQNLQYYLAYGQMIFTSQSIRNNMTHLKNNTPAMLQGFSTNQGTKNKPNKRNRKNKGQCQPPRKRRNN